MQRRSLLAYLGTLMALPSFSAARNITRVIVRDADFRPIREIASSAELASFAQHWSTRTPSAGEALHLHLKIDIHHADRSERWLYDPAGYARALSKNATPTYKIATPLPFNMLLGIRSSPITLPSLP